MKVKKVLPSFTDKRGSIYDILENVPVGHIGLITSAKGSVRGRHYHKKSTQFTYVVSGRLEFQEKDATNSTAKLERKNLESGDLVETPPFIAHAMKFLEDSIILDFTTRPRTGRGYEEDTVRVSME